MDLLKQAAHTLMARFVMAILPLLGLFGGGHAHIHAQRLHGFQNCHQAERMIATLFAQIPFSISADSAPRSAAFGLYLENVSLPVLHMPLTSKLTRGPGCNRGLSKRLSMTGAAMHLEKRRHGAFLRELDARKKIHCILPSNITQTSPSLSLVINTPNSLHYGTS